MPDTDKIEKQMDLSEFSVLIVEDYPFIAQILSLSLKEIGIGTVTVVENGELAKTKLQMLNNFESKNNIDVVILDWLMPVMDGQEFLKWLRSYERDTVQFLPVIVCSAYTSEALVNESRDMGANEVIVKPVSAMQLAQRIQYVINKPRSFVKNKTFFGPDRRRQNIQFDGDDRRKTKPQDIKKTNG